MTTTIRYCIYVTFAALLMAMPFAVKATVFFSDSFTNGSTINSSTPADPTSTNAAYQMLSTKSQTPTPAVGSGDLVFGIPATSSGVMEIQALFATNPIALVLPGDNIQLTIVFTNTSGILNPTPGSSQLGIGLFNSGNIVPFNPLPGGASASTLLTITDHAEKWEGYVGQIVSGASKIMTRPSQATATTGWNQELVLSGSSSSTARNQANVGSSTTTAVTLTVGATYTEVLSITKNDVDSLAITNTLYSGPDTSGSVVVSSGGIATNTTFLTGGFDGFGFGYQSKVNGPTNTIHVSSIEISGSVTAITGPPTIDTEPVSVSVATNGSCYFEVAATGYTMTYQWYRNGSALSDGGNISGAKNSMLIIDNANAGDAFSGANGYYCVVTGAGNYSTNSTTNSLTLVPKKNLEWNGTGASWDFSNTYWNDLGNGNNPTNFNFGDSVAFNDTGAGNVNVSLSDKFLSASIWLVSGSTAYAFTGSGYMAGAGQLVFNSSAVAIQMFCTNAHTGGTVVSNDNPSMILYFDKYQALGSGPLTLAKPGSLEIAETGGATKGIAGDVVVNDNFTIQFDGSGTYAGVIFGNISGTPGKTLTLAPQNTSNTNRYRVSGNSTACDANIAINPNGSPTSQAQYDGTVLAPYGSGTQTYNGVISGYGGIIQRNGTTILNGANTYSGGTTPTTGSIGLGNNNALGTGPLIIAPEVPNTSGSGTVFASGGARTIANSLVYPSGTNHQTLIIGGTNDITFTSAIDLNGLDNTGNPGSRTIQVNNTAATTLSGVISDSSANNIGFSKTGAGALTLGNTETYSGPTTVSGGTLLVNGQLAGGAVTVTNAALGGTGTISGPVTVQINGSLAPGNSIGTLTINNTLTLQGGSTTSVEINKTSSTSDRVNVTTANYNGTLSVINLSGALAANDQFTLFNATSFTGNFTNIVGSAGSGLGFSFNPTNGVLTVVQTVATNPTNITFSVSGNTLSLSWPGDHLGWELQSNSVGLTATNSWFVVPNSTTTTNVNITLDTAATNVFYRMHLTP